MLYLDANVFIYASEPASPLYSQAKALIRNVISKRLEATTSVETIQEIIHVSKKFKELEKGIRRSNLILRIIQEPLPVDNDVIREYLRVIREHPSFESRDAIHLATCLRHKIKTLVTEDKRLREVRLKGVKVTSIREALKDS